ncbi:MAG TPA: MaoC family dehydratase [Casimicrobiaceae bacterium]|nr:MaoC family dehydratase [Casimicrobiaceae bacterium]
MEQGKTRVATDAQGPRAEYDDIEVGRSLGDIEWVVTDDMIDAQCAMDADYAVWYSLDSPWGGRIAPPQISYRPPRWLLSRTYNVRGLFYKWEIENVRPIRPGVTLRVSARIAEKYVKNEREFVVYEAEASNPDGAVVFRTRRTHVLDFIERSVQREGEGIDSGIKPERI